MYIRGHISIYPPLATLSVIFRHADHPRFSATDTLKQRKYQYFFFVAVYTTREFRQHALTTSTWPGFLPFFFFPTPSFSLFYYFFFTSYPSFLRENVRLFLAVSLLRPIVLKSSACYPSLSVILRFQHIDYDHRHARMVYAHKKSAMYKTVVFPRARRASIFVSSPSPLHFLPLSLSFFLAHFSFSAKSIRVARQRRHRAMRRKAHRRTRNIKNDDGSAVT